MRKILILILILICSLHPSLAEETPRRVFTAEKAQPFGEDEAIFHVYVCPLMGADCMILVQGNDVMLVDMGKANQYADIKNVLDTLGIEHIKYAFNTHPHDDHLGSMKKLVSDVTFDVFMTAFPDNYTGNSIIQQSTIDVIKRAGIPIERIEDGYTFSLGDAQLTVMQQSVYRMPNPRSCMLMAELGECKILLAADVIGDSQQLFADTKDLDADILKYPHHGLNRVITDFLSDISPEYAVFTHGYLDTQDAQLQLDKANIWYDFATWGLIHLSTNGEYWIVEQTPTEEGRIYEEKYMQQKESD